jgi:hypothetical protein
MINFDARCEFCGKPARPWKSTFDGPRSYYTCEDCFWKKMRAWDRKIFWQMVLAVFVMAVVPVFVCYVMMATS